MNATTRPKSSLTPSQRRATLKRFRVYRNTGTVATDLWVYQPHDFDSSFELWSDGYKTRREATEAAYDELVNGNPDDLANMTDEEIEAGGGPQS